MLLNDPTLTRIYQSWLGFYVPLIILRDQKRIQEVSNWHNIMCFVQIVITINAIENKCFRLHYLLFLPTHCLPRISFLLLSSSTKDLPTGGSRLWPGPQTPSPCLRHDAAMPGSCWELLRSRSSAGLSGASAASVDRKDQSQKKIGSHQI